MASASCTLANRSLSHALSTSRALDSCAHRERFATRSATLPPGQTRAVRISLSAGSHLSASPRSELDQSRRAGNYNRKQVLANPIGVGGQVAPHARRQVVATAGNPLTQLLTRFSGSSTQKREQLKEELLDLIGRLDRGADATPEEKAEVDRVASRLEAISPNPKSLSSPLINGKWKLLYTTSESILGSKRPKPLRPNGAIFQYIDAEQLAAKNTETWPFFNQVTAKLTPESPSKVKVQFQYFKIFGLIPVKAPESARGYLDTTYVDEDLRISRGDKGNIFVLQQMDNSARLGPI